MDTKQKQEAIERIADIRFGVDLHDRVTASPIGLEDGSEPGILRGLCGRGATQDEAVENLFRLMYASPRLIRGAYTTRRAYIWHEASQAFVGISE